MTFASKKTCRDRHRLRRLTNSHRNSRNFSRRSKSTWTTRDEEEEAEGWEPSQRDESREGERRKDGPVEIRGFIRGIKSDTASWICCSCLRHALHGRRDLFPCDENVAVLHIRSFERFRQTNVTVRHVTIISFDVLMIQDKVRAISDILRFRYFCENYFYDKCWCISVISWNECFHEARLISSPFTRCKVCANHALKISDVWVR